MGYLIALSMCYVQLSIYIYVIDIL